MQNPQHNRVNIYLLNCEITEKGDITSVHRDKEALW
jgi:hypothetical protein